MTDKKYSELGLEFGKNVNVTLSSISEKCMAEATLASKKRQLGNSCFQEKKYHEAIEQYTQALKHCPEDIVLYSNRAAAYIKIGLVDENAMDDLSMAFYLLKEQGVSFTSPLYRKIFLIA